MVTRQFHEFACSSCTNISVRGRLVNGGGALSDSLVYFLFFSLGFGWPLVLLPMLAAPVQQRLTQVLTRHHRAVSVVSGLLLVGLAVFGWFVEIRPN